MKVLKIGIVVTVLLIVVSAFVFDFGELLSLQFLKMQKDSLLLMYQANPIIFILMYMGIYIVSTSVSLPGATVLTVAGGAIFGTILGTGIVAISATIGATVSCLAARFLLREWIELKYHTQISTFNNGVVANGVYYVLFLRLVPLFPFFIVNVGLGLTRLPIIHYIFASLFGMIPGTFVYVNAGKQLSQINQLSDVFSMKMLVMFGLLGGMFLLPVLIKKWQIHKKASM